MVERQSSRKCVCNTECRWGVSVFLGISSLCLTELRGFRGFRDPAQSQGPAAVARALGHGRRVLEFGNSDFWNSTVTPLDEALRHTRVSQSASSMQWTFSFSLSSTCFLEKPDFENLKEFDR